MREVARKLRLQSVRGENSGDVAVRSDEYPLTRFDPVSFGDMTIFIDEFISVADGDDTNTRDGRRPVVRLITEQGPMWPLKNREEPCPLPGLSATGRVRRAIARLHFSAHGTGHVQR